MERVVIAFGGSILAPEKPDPASINQYAEAVKMWAEFVQPLIVVGGGDPARRAIDLARNSSSSEDDLDRIGIAATRLNAQVFLAFLKGNGVDVNSRVCFTTDEATQEAEDHQTVVMGGTSPGHSTDEVAISLARKTGASRIIIVTNVDGVYTADPNQDAGAQRIERLTPQELLQIVGGPQWTHAGSKGIVDGPGAQMLCQTGTETRVVSGRNLVNIANAVLGRDFDGTCIVPAATVTA